ncbi:hypothetical protein C4546_03610 [Candidatus Parcubacteria bacterium]|jgi:hypothetical protein|nr:MAG: hypothetical protein C4546_03610 [Candidatus Parcubacteria bacterium]
MKIPLAIRGVKDVVWAPGTFFTELQTAPKMWPTIIVPYLLLFFIVILWYHTAAEVIAASHIVDGNLSDMELKYQTLFGSENLVTVLKKTQLVGYGGMVLLTPLLMALIGYLLIGLVKSGSKYSQILSIILYGEIIYRIGDILAALTMFWRNDPNVAFSLGGILGKFTTLTPALKNLLALTNPFLIWEIIVIAIGFSAVVLCARSKSVKLSILTVCSLIFARIIISLWIQ